MGKSGVEANTQDVSIKNEFMEFMRKQDNEINDICFTLNLKQEGYYGALTSEENYSGLVSLCSTTIYNFMNGVYCGRDAILTCEQSSFISLRCGGFAIESLCPKLVKVMNGSIQKCEGGGIKISINDPFHKNDESMLIGKEDDVDFAVAPDKAYGQWTDRSLGTARGEERKGGGAEDPNQSVDEE